MLATRSLIRNRQMVMQRVIAPLILNVESQSPLTNELSSTGAGAKSTPSTQSLYAVNSDVYSGNIIARRVHEDSNQYQINKNKNLGPDADPYRHTPDTIGTNSAMQSPPKDDHDAEGVLNQFNDDTSVRPYGSFAEQDVAADRSKIDPLADSKKVRSGKILEKETVAETSSDSSPIYGGK